MSTPLPVRPALPTPRGWLRSRDAEAGNVKTETDARNITVTYTWDALNRLTKKQSSNAASPVYQYVYDECGAGRLCRTLRTLNNYVMYDQYFNVASLTDIGSTLLSYSYDSTGRLTGAIDTAAGSFGSLAWTYDQNGNHQTETRNAGTLPYVYSPPNWLYQKGTDTRPKTASGNTASSTAIGSFTYDGFNRLATSQTAAETTTYTYNALGERIKKINQNNFSTVFHYGPNGELLYEQDANGNTKAYVWLNGRPLARIDNDAQIYYYHVDHLGTPQAMTNSTGATVWKADYEPYPHIRLVGHVAKRKHRAEIISNSEPTVRRTVMQRLIPIIQFVHRRKNERFE